MSQFGGSLQSGLTVEENNLTVQLAALRRILDTERTDGSCIETLPGRGYRFIAPVATPVDLEAVTSAAPAVRIPPPTTVAAGRVRGIWFIAAIIAVALVGVLVWGTAERMAGRTSPRLSLVVLPFDNLRTDPGDSGLAEAISTDLASDLARDTQTTVAAAPSIHKAEGRPPDPRRVGRTLNVRYVVEGSLRREGSTLDINAAVVSAEDATTLWSSRFDASAVEPGSAQDRIVARLRSGVLDALIGIENARRQPENADGLDAFDLVLRARAMSLRP